MLVQETCVVHDGDFLSPVFLAVFPAAVHPPRLCSGGVRFPTRRVRTLPLDVNSKHSDGAVRCARPCGRRTHVYNHEKRALRDITAVDDGSVVSICLDWK